ncbi:TPA: response regulator transcription factor [Klebsiella aerogenes]|nr:response regulator transcription factor [Klebsiella aerogenes]HDU3701948.1 response regulator transcription factor [Klebsiella aerogenes]HDU3712596.1 response regulator transcription factor [Klebsiella aerogenes]
MSKTAIIVDDHPLLCQAVRNALDSIGFETIGETSDGVNALQMIESRHPDIVILDIGLEKIDGLTVLKRIVRQKLDTRVLVYTSQTKQTFAARCLQAGASGFVSKSEPISQLIKAIETIASGHVLFPELAVQHFANASGPSGRLENLSDREMQILILLAEGLPNRTIAEKLNISSKTVSGHKVNLMMKLSISSVVELAAIAKQHNLI